MEMTLKKFTLRDCIAEAKARYRKHYGKLDWRFTDEGLPWAIQDYHGSIGSVMDFTPDDWLACKENGWGLDEVCQLCSSEQFCTYADHLTDFLSFMPDDMDKDDAIAAVHDFYTWRDEILPVVLKIHAR